MADSSCRRGPPQLLPILLAALVVVSCEDDTINPQDEFPDELYSLDFEGAAFNGGEFVGRGEWASFFGTEAASVVSQDARAPKSGTRSLRVDGSRLGESQGFYFGSYARPMNYSPLQAGTPRIVMEGWIALAGDDGPTCGNGLGLTGLLNGEPVPNFLIGIQELNGTFVPYLANYDTSIVYGSAYDLGEWWHVRAVLDFERKTVEGFVNGEPIGSVPFTAEIGDEILFINLSLGSSHPMPDMNSYFDDVRVAAGPRRSPS